MIRYESASIGADGCKCTKKCECNWCKNTRCYVLGMTAGDLAYGFTAQFHQAGKSHLERFGRRVAD
jgi:hypothetical protein